MRYLYDNGASLELYCAPSEYEDNFKKFFPKAKYNNTRPEQGRKISAIFKQLFSVFVLLFRNNIDIVIWSYSGYRENFIFALFRIFGGPRLVIKNDSTKPPRPMGVRSWLSYLFFFKFPSRVSDILIAETNDVKQHLLKFYGFDKNLYLMPNGVPLTLFDQWRESFSNDKSPVDGPYILYTGRIDFAKGIDVLIECFAKIAKDIPDWTLQIVGMVWDEDYDKKIKLLIDKEGLKKRIIINDPAFGRDLYRWYHFAEFFVLPSRHEGLANRIPEAMYFKNPVIAFDVGQTKSMVNIRTGQLVDEGNVGSFSKAMLEHANDNDMRKNKGITASQMVELKYNDDILIPQFLRKCRELIN